MLTPGLTAPLGSRSSGKATEIPASVPTPRIPTVHKDHVPRRQIVACLASSFIIWSATASPKFNAIQRASKRKVNRLRGTSIEFLDERHKESHGLARDNVKVLLDAASVCWRKAVSREVTQKSFVYYRDNFGEEW